MCNVRPDCDSVIVKRSVPCHLDVRMLLVRTQLPSISPPPLLTFDLFVVVLLKVIDWLSFEKCERNNVLPIIGFVADGCFV